MRGDRLIVFVKAPRPGAVKTRLARDLGAAAAADLYRRIAERVLRGSAPAGDEYLRTVAFAPADARDEIAAWLPGEELRAQRGGDLGERMAAAFADAFAAGSRRVALAGSDVPELTRERVGEAFSALDGHDMALGPAADGGYYLVALARPRPALFEGVAWSTERVLAETLERAAAAGLRVRLLGTLRDVDTPEDARRFEEEEASHARR